MIRKRRLQGVQRRGEVVAPLHVAEIGGSFQATPRTTEVKIAG
jgi:hypothetical protein